MSSTFSNLKFELIGVGEQSGTWGTTTNANIGTAIEQAIVGMATLDSGDFTANVATLMLTNTNAAQDARALCLNIASGAVSAAGTVNVPAIEKPYIVINGSSFAVTVKVSGQTGVAVPAGTRTIVYNNGTDVGTQLNWLNSLTLGAALPVASGGSGATTASGARTNFGATTLGANLFTISNPSAVTFPRFNADNTVSSLNAADFRTAIGAGTGDVTLAGTQTLTNKTIAFSSNTLTDVAGTTATQTLTNKTISGADNTLTVDGTVPVGFRTIPQNSQSAAYTLVLADSGKHILHPSTDANARTFTIPANSSVAYPIGTAITFVNMTSEVVTIAITSDTLTLSSAGTSGSRSLAQYGSATALKIGATQWLISGSGLT